MSTAAIDPVGLGVMDEEAAGDVLAASPAIRRVRERLLDGATLSWSSWSQTVREVAGTDADPARFLMDSARARDRRAPPPAIAGRPAQISPARLHLFTAPSPALRTLGRTSWMARVCQCLKIPVVAS